MVEGDGLSAASQESSKSFVVGRKLSLIELRIATKSLFFVLVETDAEKYASRAPFLVSCASLILKLNHL